MSDYPLNSAVGSFESVDSESVDALVELLGFEYSALRFVAAVLRPLQPRVGTV